MEDVVQQVTVIALVCSLMVGSAGCAAGERYDVAMAPPARDASAVEMARAAPIVGSATAGEEAKASVPPPVEGAAANRAGQRVIIYSGLLHLVVSDIATTLDAVRAQAQSMGGYLQEQDASSITVRIPAAKFQDAVAAFSRLGVLTQKQIKAQDVTEEMRDLRIRLD